MKWLTAYPRRNDASKTEEQLLRGRIAFALLTAVALVTSAGCSSALSARTLMPQGRCPTDSVCLNVESIGPGQPQTGRLVVLWDRMGRKRPAPVVVGYDVPFSGLERSVRIPFSHIRPPNDRQFPGVVMGYVLVMRRAPRKGESLKRLMVGAGNTIVAHSLSALSPKLMAPTFPAGVARGFAAYGLRRVRSFDRMVLAPKGTVFQLGVCPREATPDRCRLRVPNIN